MMLFFSVPGGSTEHGAVRRHSRRRHDRRVRRLHPQPRVLALGRLLHHLHRAGRARLHGLLGRPPRLHLHDQPHHVHRVSPLSFGWGYAKYHRIFFKHT
jgi:hypothetical protein